VVIPAIKRQFKETSTNWLNITLAGPQREWAEKCRAQMWQRIEKMLKITQQGTLDSEGVRS